MQKFTDLRQWSQDQWLNSNLGDKRRNERAIKLGIVLMTKPNESLSRQTQSWGELKSAYRLFNEKDVTYEQLQKPHQKKVKETAAQSNDKGVVFVYSRYFRD